MISWSSDISMTLLNSTNKFMTQHQIKSSNTLDQTPYNSIKTSSNWKGWWDNLLRVIIKIRNQMSNSIKLRYEKPDLNSDAGDWFFYG